MSEAIITSKGVTLLENTAWFYQYIQEWLSIKIQKTCTIFNTLFRQPRQELQKTVKADGSSKCREAVNTIQDMKNIYVNIKRNYKTYKYIEEIAEIIKLTIRESLELKLENAEMVEGMKTNRSYKKSQDKGENKTTKIRINLKCRVNRLILLDPWIC